MLFNTMNTMTQIELNTMSSRWLSLVLRLNYSERNGHSARFGQFIQFDYGQATFGMPDHVKQLGLGVFTILTTHH